MTLAILLAFLILRGSEDLGLTPIGDGSATDATTTPAASDVDTDAAPIVEPTVVTAAARANGEVVVLVANGSDVSGEAGRLTDLLRNQGFNTRQPKTAFPLTASVIYYRPSFAAEAMVVRATLNSSTPIAPMPEPDPNVGVDVEIGPVDVLILVGVDGITGG